MGMFKSKKKTKKDVVTDNNTVDTSALNQSSNVNATETTVTTDNTVGEQQLSANQIYNTMPGQIGETQPEVELPEEASILSDARAKVAHPLKPYRYTIINGVGKKENGLLMLKVKMMFVTFC